MTEDEIKALINLLEDDDPEISNHVHSKLIDLGEEAVPFLESQWEETLNLDYQAKIEELIHQIQFQKIQVELSKWKEAGAQDLLEALWLISTYQYPDVSLESIRQQIDQIYFSIWSQFKDDLQPMDQVKLLNHNLFKKERFGANTKNFHSPANSMINRVLESRKGNPLSLGAIYLLIAQRMELPIYGVNLPNLFVLTYKVDQFQFYINAFNKGIIFTKEEIDQYLKQLDLKPQESYYQPCSNTEMIQRLLRNLMVAFKKTGETEKLAEMELLLRLLD